MAVTIVRIAGVDTPLLLKEGESMQGVHVAGEGDVGLNQLYVVRADGSKVLFLERIGDGPICWSESREAE